MTGLSSDLHGYYRSVADILPCSGHAKKKYLNELRGRLRELQEEKPDADRETACERFGTPEEIAESWLENLSARDYKKRVAFSKRTKVLIAVFAALAVVGLILLGRFYLKYREAMLGDFIVYVEEGEIPNDITDEELRKMEEESYQRAKEILGVENK